MRVSFAHTSSQTVRVVCISRQRYRSLDLLVGVSFSTRPHRGIVRDGSLWGLWSCKQFAVFALCANGIVRWFSSQGVSFPCVSSQGFAFLALCANGIVCWFSSKGLRPLLDCFFCGWVGFRLTSRGVLPRALVHIVCFLWWGIVCVVWFGSQFCGGCWE